MAAYNVTLGSNSGLQVGHNSGTIVHTAAKQKLERAFYVPDILSPNFVGREDELKRIRDIHRESSRCIIYGMPGLGKSQVALKYAHTAKDEYSYIFWLSASSVDKFESGFAEIIGYVFEDADKTIPATRRWLERADKWLLIIDNVSSEALSSLRSILPQKRSILLTTRFEHVAQSLCSVQHRIELQVLPPADSVNLFIATRKYFDQETADPDAINLIVKKVGHLPLAIDQAASLSVAPGQSIASVLEIYQGSDILEAITWENDLGLHEESSVFSCFRPILDQVQKLSPVAFHLLCMLAFLDPENIPLWLLERGLSSERVRVTFIPELQVEIGPPFQDLHTMFTSPIQKQKAIQVLIRSSLVKYKSTKAFWIHDVIHLLLHQYFLDKQRQQSIWLGVAVNMIGHVATRPRESSFHWDYPNIQSLLAHAEQIRKYLDQHEHESPEFLIVEATIAKMLGARAIHQVARKIGEQVLPKLIKFAGVTDDSTLDAMYNLARVYDAQNCWDSAEALLLMSIGLAKLKYGLAHEVTLDHMSALALVHSHQGREIEAIELSRGILSASTELPAYQSQAFVQYVLMVAERSERWKQWRTAESLRRSILYMQRFRLGPKDLKTLSAMADLALNLHAQGKLEESEALMVSVLEIHNNTPDRGVLSNLVFKMQYAGMLIKRRRMTEGLLLMETVIQGFEETLGPDHAYTSIAKALQLELMESNRELATQESSSATEAVDALGTQENPINDAWSQVIIGPAFFRIL